MIEKNCELLFEYLRSILYDEEVNSPDVESLDEPFQKLGYGLQYLEQAVKEMKDYAEALSKGNLSVKPPSRDNFLCENLKNIHANLNHLTWQAKQVAKGDYSQTVSYLGEFSDAFNTMTRQLSERESVLIEEVNMKKQKEEELKAVANKDKLTDIGNRHYFFSTVEVLFNGEEPFIFCYCDIDHLKYINDNFGHGEGDWYIKHFASVVQNNIRQDDVFARIGGDEFCIIFRNCPPDAATEKLDRMMDEFSSNSEKPYPKSFSYGIVEVDPRENKGTVEEIIHMADEKMYEQKYIHQKSFREYIKALQNDI